MNPLQILAGVVAGVVGAAIWAAIAYYANMEVGYVALGIGALVGFAMASTGKHGTLAGIGAVLITIVAILGGKYASVELAIHNAFKDIPSLSNGPHSDEQVTGWLADDVVVERQSAGESLEWPSGMSYENAEAPADYPADVWTEAKRRWNAMNEEDKQAYQKQRIDTYNENLQAGMNALRQQSFLSTFGLFDLLFFGLAILTAWGIANGYESDDSAGSSEPSEPTATV